MENFDYKIDYFQTDYLIIGSGIAGLYTAYKLSNIGTVTVLTKEQLEDSNTQFAQGGIAAVLDKGDSLELHKKDTLMAGAGLCNEEAVDILVREGPERVRELIELGTNFDHIEGELDLTKEGAHSKRRILHARGDATGQEIRESLTHVVNNHENIIIKEEHFMVDFIQNKQKEIIGVMVWSHKSNQYQIYRTGAVILGSGGCGQIYKNTSNPEVTTGDGVAAAFRVGADIMDMEFMQFHPTTLYNPGSPSFLISESVRGEGGVLRNSKEKRFMPEYHELEELAPRDVVARAIIKEIKNGSLPYVWLDVTHLDSEYIKERFPTIFNTLLENGLDMRKEYIPVIPAAHYMMGGVKTDIDGKTSLPGLYACGEVACTGVHGANRLASNSLLEGLVFGYRIYKLLSLKKQKTGEIDNNKTTIRENKSSSIITEDILPQIKNYDVKRHSESTSKVNEMRIKLQEKMMFCAGIMREGNELKQLKSWLKNEQKKLLKIEKIDEKYWELENMVVVSKLITAAALKRTESRGGHYRDDYPERKRKWINTHILFNEKNPEGTKYVIKQKTGH